MCTGKGKENIYPVASQHYINRKPKTNTRTRLVNASYLLYSDPAVSGDNDSRPIYHHNRGSGCFRDLMRVFISTQGPWKWHTVVLQAPFPASAQSLRGRYPYGTQTHPLTSQKHQPCLQRKLPLAFPLHTALIEVDEPERHTVLFLK